MKNTFYVTPFALLITFYSLAQSMEVNSDGTHSTSFDNGNISIKINPDGTHAHIFNNGNTSIQVNPDGTHSNIFHNGNISTRINPDGTHDTLFNVKNENASTQLIPNGMHTVMFYRKNSSATRVNPDGWYALRVKPENLHCMHPDITTDAAETDSTKLNYKKKLRVRKPFRR